MAECPAWELTWDYPPSRRKVVSEIDGAAAVQEQQDRPLIVRLRNWVGDVVLGVPALQLLQRHGYSPVLVGKGWAPALLSAQGWPVHVRPGETLGARVTQLRGLREAARRIDPGFDRRDNALVLPTSFSSALEMRLAGLKAHGYRQEARGLLLRRAHPIVYGGHALTSYWELACHFLGIQEAPPADIGLKVSDEQKAQAEQLRRGAGIAPGYVVICPFAGGTFEKLDKTWPHFPAFAKALKATGRDVVICPGPGEDGIVDTNYGGAICLPGVKLGVYNALLQEAALVVSNDTGPAHMAAAVGGRVLSVLGPTKPEQWAPWGRDVHIAQRYPEWMGASEVLSMAEGLLARPLVRTGEMA